MVVFHIHSPGLYLCFLLAASIDEHQPDLLTVDWPVPADMKDELRALAATHRVQPLAVYKDEQYIQPEAVNAALKYALVEVHFTLKHFCICKREAKPLDSFTGEVQQIVILKSGEARSSGMYKRKNLLDGPFRPKPFAPVMAPSASRLTDGATATTTSGPIPYVQPATAVLPAPADTILAAAKSFVAVPVPSEPGMESGNDHPTDASGAGKPPKKPTGTGKQKAKAV